MANNVYLRLTTPMKELSYLNKYLSKYKTKIMFGLLITIIARIFAIVTPNLIGDSITTLENFYISKSLSSELVKEKLYLTLLSLLVQQS